MKLLLTGGGSGGPTTPLLALHQALQQNHSINALFLGTATGPEQSLVAQAGIPFESIPSGKLRRYWSWQNFVDPLKILAGFFVAFQKLRQFQPDVIVSAGSFVSVPVAYAAFLLKIPHVILQMDVKPGLANRLMAPVSCRLAYHFEESRAAFGGLSAKRIGPVVRQSIDEASAEKANERFQLDPEKPVLLITGGGQGSVALNEIVAQLLPIWLPQFQVVHLTGPKHDVSTQGEGYHPIPFVNEGMGDLLARSNLVISRAGIGTLGELAALKKDTILVPMPNSHQVLNAQALAKENAVIMVPQSELTDSWWQTFMASYEPDVLGNQLHHTWPNSGSQDLAQMVLEEMK